MRPIKDFTIRQKFWMGCEPLVLRRNLQRFMLFKMGWGGGFPIKQKATAPLCCLTGFHYIKGHCSEQAGSFMGPALLHSYCRGNGQTVIIARSFKSTRLLQKISG